LRNAFCVLQQLALFAFVTAATCSMQHARKQQH